MKKKKFKHTGFTLIEVIVALIVASILGVMVVQFTQTSSVDGVQSAVWFQEETRLQIVCEKMTTKYKKMLADNNLSLSTFYAELLSDTEIKNFINTSKTGYISFTGSSKVYSASAPSQNPSGTASVLMVTVGNGDNQLTSFFVD